MNRDHYPTFVVVGAAKSGTSSLYTYLDNHSEVFMSRIKETNYFAKDIKPEEFTPLYLKRERDKAFDINAFFKQPEERRFLAYVEKKEHYEQLFAEANGCAIRGEVSNSYMYSQVAAEEIHKTIPDAKIIAILRHPADRMFSHYLNKLRDGQTAYSFTEAIEADQYFTPKGWGKSHLYYELGCYGEQLERFYKRFDPAQILVIDFDELQTDVHGFYKKVSAFLDVKFEADAIPNRQNASAIPKSALLNRVITKTGVKKRVFATLPTAVQQQVKQHWFTPGKDRAIGLVERDAITSRYVQDIRKLESITGLNFSHWYDS